MAGSTLPARPLSAKESLELLEREVGGRSEIIQALVTAPQSKDVKYLLGLLADPENARLTLFDICTLSKLLPGQILDLIEQGQKLRTRVIAGAIVAQHTPAMVRDVMQKAAPYEDACNRCWGSGQITPEPTPATPNPTPEPCKTCLGTGRLRYDADGECRKLGLEMAGLTAKGGGIVINNANQLTAPTVQFGGMNLEAFQEAMDRVLYGRSSEARPLGNEPDGPAIDATIVPPEDV